MRAPLKGWSWHSPSARSYDGGWSIFLRLGCAINEGKAPLVILLDNILIHEPFRASQKRKADNPFV